MSSRIPFRVWLVVIGCAAAMLSGALAAQAAKVTGMTPGMLYVAPGHGEVLFEAFNPTTKPITVRFQILAAQRAWDLTDYSLEIAPGTRDGVAYHCDDAIYCGGMPVISPATVVPSLRWQPITGGYDVIPAGSFRTMK